ncbi:hypothetical protein MRS76_03505 [Rhizobiaceae bacterium n13]|uniref:DUF541 domain-containing protein n=1 Tax=Ferirhizobium litorale TaxID=2927786 RepID=A0AAE3QBX4_9HYPH|nr:hypothetical protein [Fererhizobium litorale]MDI7861011.1 hypothetical protein [Fererhizobium litorale]MDI7921158.1 hypothetical protein [Fererhizobium litorale]
MNKLVVAAIAAGISLTSFCSVVYADPFLMTPAIDGAVKGFTGDRFLVKLLKPSGAGDLSAEAAAEKNTPAYQALQASIDANKGLAKQLEAQNVEINNIVAAEVATDGSLVFYVQ